MPPKNLGAIIRPKDPRDILLGGVQAPVTIPATYVPDMSWMKRNYQWQTTYCGEHAGAHFKAIKEYNDSGVVNRFSPRFGAIHIKNPKSPVYDGYAPDAGTDMKSIFKWLQKIGADVYEPLENDVTLPINVYLDPAVVTSAETASASQHTITSYAFDALTFDALCQAIYQSKAVLLLIKCDNGFWGTSTPTFTTPMYGHFVCAYGYDQNYLYIVDSADPSDAFAFKKIAKKYVTPTFFFESGTAIDLPPEQVQALIQQSAAVVQEVSVAPIPPAEKSNILTIIFNFFQSLFPKVGSASQTTMKPWYLSKTVWFNAVTVIVAIAAYFGWTPDQQLTSTISSVLVGVAPFVNIALRFVTKQPISLPVTPSNTSAQ